MIALRAAVSIDATTAAFGATVVDAEPTPVPGSYASVCHAFRAEPPRPGALPVRISVLPYAEPAWTRAGRAWFAWEAEIWSAFWAAIRARGPDPSGRWPIAPLIDPPATAIRVFELPTAAGPLVAFARPWLPWPTVAAADLPEERIRAAWARGVGALADHLGPDVAVPTLPADLASLPDARRRLLTDGHRIIPTHWRAFDPRWQGIDLHRRRVP